MYTPYLQVFVVYEQPSKIPVPICKACKILLFFVLDHLHHFGASFHRIVEPPTNSHPLNSRTQNPPCSSSMQLLPPCVFVIRPNSASVPAIRWKGMGTVKGLAPSSKNPPDLGLIGNSIKPPASKQNQDLRSLDLAPSGQATESLFAFHRILDLWMLSPSRGVLPRSGLCSSTGTYSVLRTE
jgi:hypothetical protein